MINNRTELIQPFHGVFILLNNVKDKNSNVTSRSLCSFTVVSQWQASVNLYKSDVKIVLKWKPAKHFGFLGRCC